MIYESFGFWAGMFIGVYIGFFIIGFLIFMRLEDDPEAEN